MADISKCLNANECPLKYKCYRFTAKDGFWQAYSEFKYDNKKKECKNYYPINK